MSLSARDCLAIAALAACALACAGWAIVAWRRTGFTWAQALLMALDHFYLRFIWRTTIEGRFDLPRGTGAVIVSNHRCPLDPAFIGAALDRMPHWMVAREYCENRWIGWFFRACRCIPTGRGGVDTASTRNAIRLARGADLVGIFPEGRINDTPALLLPGRHGAALVALRARAPIVPCFIEGSPYSGNVYSCLFMTARVRLRIGQPIDISAYYGRENDREVLETLTRQLMVAIATLAGQPNFSPTLAGRFVQRD